MEKKVRNQFLIGVIIGLLAIAMYFSGIIPGQVTECTGEGGAVQCLDYSAFERSTIPTLMMITGIVFIIRGTLMLRNSSLK
jgi:hypothetical protein|tara:strand:+ start:615 stop:857 length:243 start_codon:yes stop_codon:yes gene_type:complete